MSFRQEHKWSPGRWFCRGRGIFHISLPQLCHKEPACRQLVGAGESFQLAACSQGLPTQIPSPFSPTCHRDVGGKMSTRPLCMSNFAPSCPWESTQQCSPSWNLPDPFAGPGSPQPLECLPTGRPLGSSYPLFRFPSCDCSVAWASALLAFWCSLNLPWYGRTWQARPVHAQTPFSLVIDAAVEVKF